MSNWPTNGNLTGKLSVGQGEAGKSLEYMWRGTELGIRQEGEEEYQFVDLAGGGAASGREIELQVGSGYIQWRYKGEESWNNLIAITELQVQGPQGIPGRDGKDGVTPNITIGTVTTLETGQQATVVKRGTIENPIFDFGIPQGKSGSDGADGVTPDMSDFEKKINEQYKNIEKKVDDHIVNHPEGGGSGVAKSDKVDYMGKQHDSLKETNDSNVEYLLRKLNTQKYEGSSITANNTYAKQVNNVILKGVTKYKDLDTGDFAESFEEGRNLELVGGKAKKLTIENHIDAISKGLIEMNKAGNGVSIIKTDNSNFIIKTGGTRLSGVSSTKFFTSNIGGTNLGMYVVEFDGKLISGDISSASGVLLAQWSNFADGYNSKLPIDGKYRAVIKSGTNTVNNRSTNFCIYTTNNVSVTNPVEYEIKNLRVYCVTDTNSNYKSSQLILQIENPLYSIGDICDYIDLNTGIYVRNIGIRAYQEGDESNDQVLTDKNNTIYKLEEPVVSKIDLQGQKVYSYDGTTYYNCQSEVGYPAPILSIEVPTDLASLVSSQKAEIKSLNEENKVQDKLINTTMLATDEMYTMLEPLLAETLNERSTSKMVDMYVAMVQRGIKTIEQVPIRYREQVKKILDQLEK